MRNIIRGIYIVIGLTVIICVGRCFYMVACISCTYPPIKEYEYPGSVNQFANAVQNLTTHDSNITYKFSRRDSSTTEDNGNRDCALVIKTNSGNIKYGLVCDNGTITNVKLVSAFKNDSIGGYGLSIPEVRQFVQIFENTFVKKLEQEEHIIIRHK